MSNFPFIKKKKLSVSKDGHLTYPTDFVVGDMVEWKDTQLFNREYGTGIVSDILIADKKHNDILYSRIRIYWVNLSKYLEHDLSTAHLKFKKI